VVHRAGILDSELARHWNNIARSWPALSTEKDNVQA
jgi:hypothetical protein